MTDPKFVRVTFADGDAYFAFLDEDCDPIGFGEDDRWLFKSIDDWEDRTTWDLNVAIAEPDDPDAKVESEFQETCRQQIPKDWPRRPDGEDY